MSGFWGDWRGNYDYEAPALEFEMQAGINGIGRHYAMPPDHDMESLEHEIKRRVKWASITMEERLRRAQGYATALTALNPCLKRVNYDRQDLMETWHFILGVTTGLNPDDIDYFINSDDSTLRRAEALHRVETTLSEKFNKSAQLYWNMSPATADLILRKMEEKQHEPSDGSGPTAFIPN